VVSGRARIGIQDLDSKCVVLLLASLSPFHLSFFASLLSLFFFQCPSHHFMLDIKILKEGKMKGRERGKKKDYTFAI